MKPNVVGLWRGTRGKPDIYDMRGHLQSLKRVDRCSEKEFAFPFFTIMYEFVSSNTAINRTSFFLLNLLLRSCKFVFHV